MIIAKPYPPRERLQELLHYDPETGVFIWKARKVGPGDGIVKTWNTRNAGNLAFQQIAKDGHPRGVLDGRTLRADKVAFIMVNGWEPDAIVHKDGDPKNVKIDNLQGYERPCASRPSNYVEKVVLKTREIAEFVQARWPEFYDGDYQGLSVPVKRELFSTVIQNDSIRKSDGPELIDLFDWSKSEQGFNYWASVQKRLQRALL